MQVSSPLSYSAAAQSGVEFVDELTDEQAAQMVSVMFI